MPLVVSVVLELVVSGLVVAPVLEDPVVVVDMPEVVDVSVDDGVVVVVVVEGVVALVL